MSSDPLSLSELDDNNEDELQASDANAGALMDPKSMVHSGMFLSLIHQICSAYEKDPSKSEKMFRLICQQMNTLKLLPPQGITDTFRPMQAAYTNAFRKMMHATLENLQDTDMEHRMLSLPATEQERTAVFLQMQSPLLRLPKITPEDIINSHTTRYHTDFEESCILGKGGFGKVYKVYSKIDQRYYAIKKIKLKQNNIEKSYKLVKEVQLLASLKHPNIVGYNTSWIEAERMNTDNTYQGLSKREPVTSLKCLPPSSSESPISSSEQESSTTDKNNVKIEDLGNKGEQSPGLWINDANLSPLNQYVLHPNADNLASSPSRLSRSPSDSTSTLVNSPITPTSTVCCPDGTPRDGFCNGDVQSTDFRNKESSFSQELSTSESSFDMWSSKTTMSVEKTMKVDSQILEDSDFQKYSSRSVSSTEHHSESRRTEVHSYTHEQDSESDIIFHNHDYVNLDSTEEYSDICFSFEKSQNDQINLLDEVRGSHTSPSEESSNSVDNVLKSFSATCNNFTEDKTTNTLQLQKDRLHVRGVFGTTLPRRLQQNVCGKTTSKMKIVNLDDSTNNQTEVRAPRQNRRRHRSKSQDGIKSTPKPETRMLSLQDFPVFRVVLCIQMQLCSHTLSDWLRQRNIKTDQVEHSLDVVNMYENMHIFKQMLDGIEYIHSQSLIHRDLKPKNIFLEGASPNLQVLIGDFGLAKEDFSHDLTPDYQNAPHARASAPKKHTAEVGTTTYASPEQLEGTMYDCKSDIYSSGIILFEMFHPFSTQMERAIVIGRVRKGCIPCEIDQKWPDQYKTIGQMTHNNSCQRPHATDVLKGPLFLSKDEVIKDLHAKLSEKDAELSEKDAELSEKDVKLSEKDAKLSEKDAELSEKDAKLCAKLSEKDAEIQRLRQIIAKLEMLTS